MEARRNGQLGSDGRRDRSGFDGRAIEIAEPRERQKIQVKQAKCGRLGPSRPRRVRVICLGPKGGFRMATSRRPPSLFEGTKVGNYTVVRFLGAGGMAEVYEVEHIFTRGRHALKILHARYAGELGPSVAMQLEGMVEAQLRHENVVR